jgi:hypothetical protein
MGTLIKYLVEKYEGVYPYIASRFPPMASRKMPQKGGIGWHIVAIFYLL